MKCAEAHTHTNAFFSPSFLPSHTSFYVFLSLSPLPSFFFPAVQEDELAQAVRRFEGQVRDLEQRLDDRSRAGELQGCRKQWPGSVQQSIPHDYAIGTRLTLSIYIATMSLTTKVFIN